MHKTSLSERCTVGPFACDDTNPRVRSLWTAENSLNPGYILVVRSSERWSRGSSKCPRAIVIAAHWRQFRRFGPQGWPCRSHFRRTRPARQRASVVSRFAEVFLRQNLIRQTARSAPSKTYIRENGAARQDLLTGSKRKFYYRSVILRLQDLELHVEL